MRNTNAPFVRSKKNDTIGVNYYHQGIKVGDTIFDNLNPNGIKYDDWLDDLEYHLNHSYNIQNLEILEW
ncbi:papain fold toxin domain-containing protein [Capnocytophaga gingivalis]|uniref:papain fold toxin domain-containing protein n=1 Tax=Capnocytophaga gingivalis TaxID=1017 RepID=UPI0038B330B1